MIRVCADGEVVLPGDTAAVDKGVVHLRIGPGLAPATGTCVFITVAGLDVQSPLFSLHVLSFLPPPPHYMRARVLFPLLRSCLPAQFQWCERRRTLRTTVVLATLQNCSNKYLYLSPSTLPLLLSSLKVEQQLLFLSLQNAAF